MVRSRKGKRSGAETKSAKLEEAKVVSVDAVTGPFDVIAQLESDDLDKLGRAITDAIQQVDGVATTCLVVRLG